MPSSRVSHACGRHDRKPLRSRCLCRCSSRCQVYILRPMETPSCNGFRPCEHRPRTARAGIDVRETEALFRFSAAMCSCSIAGHSAAANEGRLTTTGWSPTACNRTSPHDKNGEQHYDVISAFIKSVAGRRSQRRDLPYRMLPAARELRYRPPAGICPRGHRLANPQRPVLLANACFRYGAQDRYARGLRIPLALERSIWASMSPKSNSAHILSTRRSPSSNTTRRTVPVLLHLRAPTA